MSLPTQLTLLRIVMTFVIMTLLFLPGLTAKVAALVCFLLASATDWLDGYLARHWRQVTALGALLDPLADKVLVLGVFLAFVQLRLVPAWMVLVIACREFLITGVRVFAASRHVVLSAAREGKHKTVSQFVTILIVLIVVLLQDLPAAQRLSTASTEAMRWTVLAALWITMLLTLISGISFLWRHRDVLLDATLRSPDER